ncbi:hypothetical protein ON010_g4514 [Phytophthora cinnamomi]|nr:hypothetical protein ON010_g4514 [Phytophthora cinnamomi]
MATLDGTLQMNSYYDMNRGEPLGGLSGGYIDMPQCPNCKKPIRGLRRYGRVTKRAAIDTAEKNFISHSRRQLSILQERANAAVERGHLSQDNTLRHDLRAFGAAVKRPPCQKAFEACVASLTKAKGGQGGGDVPIDQSALPVPNSKFQFLGYFYLISAQLSWLGASASPVRAATYARQAITAFGEASLPHQSREAHLMLVQILLGSAEETLNGSVKTEKERKAREEAVEKLCYEASYVLNNLATSTTQIAPTHAQDIQSLRQRLLSIVRRARDFSFYQKVSMEEMKAIKTAMQAEFRGSGHWYRCANGHSYSIGECGMAMEETTCPECGEPVGGSDHTLVQGSRYDSRMDAL